MQVLRAPTKCATAHASTAPRHRAAKLRAGSLPAPPATAAYTATLPTSSISRSAHAVRPTSPSPTSDCVRSTTLTVVVHLPCANGISCCAGVAMREQRYSQVIALPSGVWHAFLLVPAGSSPNDASCGGICLDDSSQQCCYNSGDGAQVCPAGKGCIEDLAVFVGKTCCAPLTPRLA